MIQRTPRSKRTDTLVPYKTIFRSVEVGIGVEPLDEGPALMAQIAFDLEVRVEAVAEPFAVLQVAAELAVQRRFRQIGDRSEEHTSELQSLMRISYAVFCLTKTTQINQ